MNIAKFAVLGAFLAPALAFGVNPDQPEKDRDEKQDQMTHQGEGQMQRSDRMDHAGRMGQGHRDTSMDGDRHGFVARPSGTVVSLDHLIGSTAKGRNNDEEFGEVQDILIDSNGQAVAAIISVGGFLGMGEKHVAVSWRQVSMEPENRDGLAGSRETGNAAVGRNQGQNENRRDQDRTTGQDHDPENYVLIVNVTEDSLKNAPEFDRTRD